MMMMVMMMSAYIQHYVVNFGENHDRKDKLGLYDGDYIWYKARNHAHSDRQTDRQTEVQKQVVV